MKNDKIVVKCNGKAMSHAILLIFCTVFMVYASIYAVLSGAIKGGSLWSVLIVLLGFIIYLISMTLLTTKLIYNRIIVDDNKLIIREAFHKTDKILIDDIKNIIKSLRVYKLVALCELPLYMEITNRMR